MTPRSRGWRVRRGHVRDALIVVIGLLGVALVLRGTVLPLMPPEHSTARLVTVRRGARVADIAQTLLQAGVIRSPTVFVLVARTFAMDRSLRAGQYELAPGMSTLAILRRLQKGSDFRVTLPEGLTVAEMADSLQKSVGMPRADIIAASRDSALRALVQTDAPALEGYLFPDTYDVLADMSAREMVEQMVRRFVEVYDRELAGEALPQRLSRHEAVTLASIVEAEAHEPSERPHIAAVYLNRLREGMRLQADPTVAYALGGRRDRLYYKDLEVDSPYNTYRHAGLPPGPIANPGLASLRAVFHPLSPCADLFFVATGDGRHVFTRTLAQHAAATRAVRGRGPTPDGVPDRATTR